MKAQDFTEDAQIIYLIDDLKKQFKNKPFVISDVIDDAGNQYVDLVQEGGGVLGIALLGYTYVLEQMGIRFLNIGGTSAGAINSLLIAACDIPEKEKTVKLLDILANKNLSDFVDGDSDAKDFIKTLLQEKLSIWKLGFKGIQVIDNFKSLMGLNPGDNFHQWLVEVLDEFDIYDTKGLENRMQQLPQSLHYRKNHMGFSEHEDREIKGRLAIIAAEVNTETKVEFPAMRDLFYKNINKPNPADFVRASMSIPLFFKPFELSNLPKDKDSKLQWKRIAGHQGGVPEKAIFVDGGIMSNFPIDVFHRHGGIPSRPTFGVKLGLERIKNNNIKNVGELLYGCFDAARNLRDFEFVNKNPDFKNLVAYIDIKDYNWLDFNVSDEMKLDLFRSGAKEAVAFLQKFKWKDYKELRKSIRGTANPPEVIANLANFLEDISSEKNQTTTANDVQALEERLYYLGEKIDLKALWIDDNPKVVEKERALLGKLGVESFLVSTTEGAKDYIQNNANQVDLIISDISRNENFTEGLEFTEWLYKVSPGFNRKVIFYIMDLDLSRGVPAYAFGITNSIVELVHLVIDLAQRRD